MYPMAQMPTSLPVELDPQKVVDAVPAEYRTYLPYVLYAIVALIVLLIARRLLQGVGRAIRRSRPPTIHPSLQKYNVDHAELDRRRREQALAIVATSTGARLAGFRIVRQVEAVFVEGYRSPDEAMTALKAAGAERGANALLNVHTERTAAGRCSASGDAVVVAPLVARSSQPPAPPEPPAH